MLSGITTALISAANFSNSLVVFSTSEVGISEWEETWYRQYSDMVGRGLHPCSRRKSTTSTLVTLRPSKQWTYTGWLFASMQIWTICVNKRKCDSWWIVTDLHSIRQWGYSSRSRSTGQFSILESDRAANPPFHKRNRYLLSVFLESN